MQRKAALQPHIGAQSEASLSRIKSFMEFETDLSALFCAEAYEEIDCLKTGLSGSQPTATL